MYEWDVSSLTSNTTYSDTDGAPGVFAGTLNGVAGFFIRIPDKAPAIGDVTTSASTLWGAGPGPEGLYYGYISSTLHKVGMMIWGVATIAGFQRGGRWLQVTKSAIPAMLRTSNNRKRLCLVYKGVNENVPLTA
jgi:hypothetical protein